MKKIHKFEIKAFIKNLKEKWFIYFIAIIIIFLAWYLYWGKITRVSDKNTFYIWVTTAEDSETFEESEYQLQDIIENLKDNKEDLGFKKFKTKMQQVDTSEEVITFNVYSQFDVDIYLIPYNMLKEDNFFSKFSDVVELGLTHPLGESGIISHTTADGRTKCVGLKVNADYALAISENRTVPSGAIENITQLIMDMVYPNV